MKHLAIEKANEGKEVVKPLPNGPTMEEWIAVGFKPQDYPPKGFSEVPSPLLAAFRSAQKVELDKKEAARLAEEKKAADKVEAERIRAEQAAAELELKNKPK